MNSSSDSSDGQEDPTLVPGSRPPEHFPSPPSGDDPSWTNTATASQHEDPSLRFGRYRVERLLGRGGFGEVYQARDDQLQRSVAIKVTLGRLVGLSEKDTFLDEARIVASWTIPISFRSTTSAKPTQGTSTSSRNSSKDPTLPIA